MSAGKILHKYRKLTSAMLDSSSISSHLFRVSCLSLPGSLKFYHDLKVPVNN